MSFGLQVFDASGNIIMDSTDIGYRYIGSYFYNGSVHEYTLPTIATPTNTVFMIQPRYNDLYLESMYDNISLPDVYVVGNILHIDEPPFGITDWCDVMVLLKG